MKVFMSLCAAVLLAWPGVALAATEIHFWHAMTGALGEALETQVKQFNESQSGSKPSEGPPVDYDQHGRATPPPVAPDRTPPHGDVLQEGVQAPGTEPADDEDPYAPSKLTGGDPLR